MSVSQNGWTAFSSYSDSRLKPLPWISGKVHGGYVYRVLDEFCRRFNAEVEQIDKASSWGFAPRPIRGTSDTVSNHASGTAVDLNATAHQMGSRGTFTPAQSAALRRLLRDFPVIRWGGDYSSRADEMHFEINASDAALARLVASWDALPGTTAATSTPTETKDEDDMAEIITSQNRWALVRGGFKNILTQDELSLFRDLGVVTAEQITAARNGEVEVGPQQWDAVPTAADLEVLARQVETLKAVVDGQTRMIAAIAAKVGAA